MSADTAPVEPAMTRSPPEMKKKITGIAYDERMLLHQANAKHPERPERLSAIMQHFEKTGLVSRCKRVDSKFASDEELLSVHSEQHLKNVRAAVKTARERNFEGCQGVASITSDTYANEFSEEAALFAAGCLLQLVREVVSGELSNGFAVIRPPGHHAECAKAMGFCLYNNVAIAATVARATMPDIQRVLIIDWDVHHGNGIQNVFEQDPSVLYISLHRFGAGFYPGTGSAEECGRDAGEGFTVNIPWTSCRAGDAEYQAAFRTIVMPIARSFQPHLVLVSAGFDAACGDPLGGFNLTPAGYAHMTAELLTLAEGRLVLCLEGGYDLNALATSAEACMRVLLGECEHAQVQEAGEVEGKQSPPPLRSGAEDDIKRVVDIQAKYWSCLRTALPSEPPADRNEADELTKVSLGIEQLLVSAEDKPAK